jgi:5-methyltetrahydropteroyltriglutamate--homocysteine methyltransferase
VASVSSIAWSEQAAPLQRKGRIKQSASRWCYKEIPLDQLCLSPQCGFSSTVHGNAIAMEAQAAKLRLVVETAREVWGTA